MKKKRLIILGILLGMALVLSGCPKNPYDAAIKGSDDVAQAVSKAIPFIAQYYSAGKLTDQEKSTAASYLMTVTILNQTFRKNVNAAHAAGATGPAAYAAIAQAFVDAVPTDPRAFHYNSVDAQTKFNEVLGAVKTVLDGIVLVIQRSKGA